MADRSAPLRILCLHGYRQSAEIFRERTGALRKILKKHAELTYISGPLRVRHPPPGQAGQPEGLDEDSRGWWFSNAQEQSFHAEEVCQSAQGLEESLEVVSRAMQEQGPFDGILGFSQGAALVAMLVGLQEQSADPRFQPGFRFAILIAGFASLCEQHARFYALPIHLPTLHVFGETDKVIPEAMSRKLLPAFQEAVVFTHAGGHYVPATGAQKQSYCQFLERFIRK
ncbi:OVCA2 Esterase, partial [Polypterus senegalus]